MNFGHSTDPAFAHLSTAQAIPRQAPVSTRVQPSRNAKKPYEPPPPRPPPRPKPSEGRMEVPGFEDPKEDGAGYYIALQGGFRTYLKESLAGIIDRKRTKNNGHLHRANLYDPMVRGGRKRITTFQVPFFESWSANGLTQRHRYSYIWPVPSQVAVGSAYDSRTHWQLHLGHARPNNLIFAAEHAYEIQLVCWMFS
jgi:hypothetical protein